MSKSAITKEGEVAIKERLAKLKFDERPRISEAIAEARAVSYTHLTLPTKA